VETINPSTGARKPFASGFNGALGLLREPLSGDLYFLEGSQLYRLPSSAVTGSLAPAQVAVPALSGISLLLLAMLVMAATARVRRKG
jgi:hypothetical protein